MNECDGVFSDHVVVGNCAVGIRKLGLKEIIILLTLSDAEVGVHVIASLKRVKNKENEHLIEQRHAAPLRGYDKLCILQTMHARILCRRDTRKMIYTRAKAQLQIYATQKAN
jgi:hypothetical protein